MGNTNAKVNEILPNVLHITDFISHEQQLSLYKAASAVSNNYSSTLTNTAHSRYAEVLSLDLTKEPPVSKTTKKVFDKFLKKICPLVSNTLEFPAAPEFQYVTGYVYSQDGKLAGHTDNIPGWVIMVALGCTANFWICTNEQDKKQIPFQSGDIFIFNTSASAAVHHGIDSIVPDSCPAFLHGSLPNQRLSLQFRQTIETELNLSSPSLPPSSHSPTQSPQNNTLTQNPIQILKPPERTHPDFDAAWTKLPFLGIPIDVTGHIFSYLEAPAFAKLNATCNDYKNDFDPIWDSIYTRIIEKERQENEEEYNLKQARGEFFFHEPFPDYTRFHPVLASTTPAKLVKLKYGNARALNRNVNMDFGSYQFKVGFCGDDLPWTFPSVWATNNRGRIFAGEQCMKTSIDTVRPLRNQVVQDYDQLLHLTEYAFIEKLQALPEECYALGQINVNDKTTKEKLTEMFFESVGVSGWYVALNSVLAMYASSKTTGIAIDIGYENTNISLVFEGYQIPELFRTVNIGGNHITRYFQKLITQRYPDIVHRVASSAYESLKHAHCYVKPTKAEPTESPPATIECTEAEFIIDKERYQAAELFFNPSLFDETEGVESLADVAAAVLKKYASDNAEEAKDLYRSINIAGCGSLLKGIGERMQAELLELTPSSYTVTVMAAPERGYYPWIGGSILGSLSTFSKMWISRPEYEESGPKIVNRKCF